MKKIVLITSLFLNQFVNAQYFEGTLTYIGEIEFSEKLQKMGITKESMLEKMLSDGSWSDTIRTSYKNGNYYTWKNTNPKSWMIYRSDKNKIYALQEGDFSDVCKVRDASKDFEAIELKKAPIITLLDTNVFVNNISCQIVRIKWKYGVYDYYFGDPNLVIDPKLFSGHFYDGWAQFLNISHSLPLKIVKKVSGMGTVTLTLILAKPELLEEGLFKIPKLRYDKKLNFPTLPYEDKMRVIK